jgi:protein-S-isoprenylcysteine O-methyltransferase Ste14
MPLTGFAPQQYCAGLLILAFTTLEALRWRRSGHTRMRADRDRGTTAVLAGCYVIAVLALSGSAPSFLFLPGWARWAGIALGTGGIALRGWADSLLQASGIDANLAPRLDRWGPYRVVRHPGYLGNLLLWTGVTLGSGNLIAAITIAVAMLAAYVVRISSEEVLRGSRLESKRRLIPFVY